MRFSILLACSLTSVVVAGPVGEEVEEARVVADVVVPFGQGYHSNASSVSGLGIEAVALGGSGAKVNIYNTIQTNLYEVYYTDSLGLSSEGGPTEWRVASVGIEGSADIAVWDEAEPYLTGLHSLYLMVGDGSADPSMPQQAHSPTHRNLYLPKHRHHMEIDRGPQ